MFSNVNLPNSKVPKYIVRTVVGACVTRTVNRIVDTIVDYESLDRKDQIVTRIGAFGIGGAASSAAGKYTDDTIDELYDILGHPVEKKNDEDIIVIDA